MTKIASRNMRVYKLFKHQLQMRESGICGKRDYLHFTLCFSEHTDTSKQKSKDSSIYLPTNVNDKNVEKKTFYYSNILLLYMTMHENSLHSIDIVLLPGNDLCENIR